MSVPASHPIDTARAEATPLRFVTAASLFDGHDAAINIMRRLIQAQGAEVIHLGHNRSVEDVPAAKELNADVLRLIKDIRNRHLNRLATDKITAAKSVLYSDVLIADRRMKDHLLNIVDTLVE